MTSCATTFVELQMITPLPCPTLFSQPRSQHTHEAYRLNSLQPTAEARQLAGVGMWRGSSCWCVMLVRFAAILKLERSKIHSMLDSTDHLWCRPHLLATRRRCLGEHYSAPLGDLPLLLRVQGRSGDRWRQWCFVCGKSVQDWSKIGRTVLS